MGVGVGGREAKNSLRGSTKVCEGGGKGDGNRENDDEGQVVRNTIG